MKLKGILLCLIQFLLPGLGESWDNYRIPYEKEFTISCPIYHDPPFPPSIYWLLPTNQLVSSDYSDETYQISPFPGANLTIKLTILETFGMYYCLAVQHNQSLDMAAIGVNVDVTLWHLKYRSKVIVGLIAAACVSVFMVIFCLVNEFQYKKQEMSTILNLDNLRLIQTYENCGINLTDVSIDNPASATSTKGVENSSFQQESS